METGTLLAALILFKFSAFIAFAVRQMRGVRK
jgi:hypothetical protein